MLVEIFVENLKDLPYLNVRKKRNICARVGFFLQKKFDFLTSIFRRKFENIIQKVLLP